MLDLQGLRLREGRGEARASSGRGVVGPSHTQVQVTEGTPGEGVSRPLSQSAWPS